MAYRCNLLYLCSQFTEQVLLKNYLERLSFLTRKDNTVGEKDVHAKIGDNVSCILYILLSCVDFRSLKEMLSSGSSFNPPLQRAECIKHALNAQGIPKNITLPEVLVTDNFLCTGGLEPNRDDVACQGYIPFI